MVAPARALGGAQAESEEDPTSDVDECYSACWAPWCGMTRTGQATVGPVAARPSTWPRRPPRSGDQKLQTSARSYGKGLLSGHAKAQT